MKKIVISALSVALMIAASTQANAALTMLVKQVPGPAPNSTAVLNLKSDAGVVSAFQGLIAGNVGLQGTMNQIQAAGIFPTPTQDFNAAIDEVGDTQFLALNADLLATTPPFESANTLGGVFTYQVAARSADKDILQIVAPTGTVITFNFRAAEAIGATSLEQDFSGTFIVGIPEPATAGLGSFALLGLAAFRRRFFA
jgi:hypothetical protein